MVLAPTLGEMVHGADHQDPAPTAWDFAFRDQGPFFIRARLRNGERTGGEFGARSFASGYPDTQDIFLERAWHLDAEGRFMSPSPASKGMLVARSDVEVIEFLKATQAELKGNGQST